jgi:VanZ family protein
VNRLATWLPPIAWMIVVLSASSAEFSAANTGGLLRAFLAWLLPSLGPHQVDVIHVVVRKLAHFTEYAILGALWFRGLARSRVARPPVAAWLALVISVACAVVDETHQSFVPSRTGSAQDVLLDSIGALAAIVPARLGWWSAADSATGLLLWISAVGGLGALALDLAAGASGGLLWVTVPLAAVLLVYRRRSSVSRS